MAPLEHDQVAELASRILGRRAGPRLAQQIFERTEGVPLMVEEFAMALAAGGRLEEHADAVELPAGYDVPLPDSVRETGVPLRTDRLSRRAGARSRWLRSQASGSISRSWPTSPEDRA